VFHIELSTQEIRLIGSVPGPAYQAARWIRQFHRTLYAHIGFMDHLPGAPVPEVLEKHGFVHVPRFELNSIRLLLQTYGPLLIKGSFSHVAQNESVVPVPEMALMRVTRYEDGDHALVLNGYWDGFRPSLLYRDPQHPHRQFVDEAARLLERQEPGVGILYHNCPAFPKPCPHVRPPKPAQNDSAPAANRDPGEP
jgi:hypothetical protein